MASRNNTKSPLDNIQEMAYAFLKSRLLFSALELDIFTNLDCNKGISAENLAAKINVDTRALTRMLDALAANKLIIKKAEEYFNDPIYKSYLVKGECDFIGNLLHVSDLWEPWTHLTEIVKTGKPHSYETISDKEDKWIQDYLMSTHWKAKLHAESIVNQINLKKVNKMLDLRCGSGYYAVEFVKQKPGLKPVLFDFPRVIHFAKEQLEKEGYADKVEFVEGDLMTDDFGSGYDLVFISNIIHEYSIWDSIKILRKVFDSMNRGGWVVINEVIIDDDRTAPLYSAMFAVNMLVNTMEGDSFTETDIWVMLREAWFSNISRKATEFETALMFAQK